MYRPHGGLGRGPFAPSAKFLRPILQRVANSSLAEQRCPVPSRDCAPRSHHIATCPRRSSSPILQNLIFGTHRHMDVPTRLVSVRVSARPDDGVGKLAYLPSRAATSYAQPRRVYKSRLSSLSLTSRSCGSSELLMRY